ncbi:hypothetical protein WICMUC_005583 [Wickerhamomyces mucosus]|uniref:Protein HIR n=1 Tax=Wickerhamomyces mucosus TaxID=1378264 RepID=A0A9P8P8F7_9ASCO|nr:hypothetical protein WICMUC_005583 [Wickerhamomyces mucosus]
MRVLKVPNGFHKLLITSIDSTKKHLITASADGVLVIWDKSTLTRIANTAIPSSKDIKELYRPLKVIDKFNDYGMTCVKFYDETHCITSDVNGRVLLIDIDTYESKELLHCKNEVNDLQLLKNFLFIATQEKIIIVNIETESQIHEILFNSEIKSISIDPTNHYLLVVGLDKVTSVYEIQIDNESDKIYSKIQENSNNSLSSIQDVCRTSWSPLGDRYALPNNSSIQATSGSNTYSIGIFDRLNWKLDYQLIGHNANVIRFSPITYKSSSNSNHINIIASAGVDKSITVWNTSFQRPPFVASNVSRKSITDLLWSENGLTLFVASESIIVFAFEEAELGQRLSNHECHEIQKSLKIPEPLKKQKLIAESNQSNSDSNRIVYEGNKQKNQSSNKQILLESPSLKEKPENKTESSQNDLTKIPSKEVEHSQRSLSPSISKSTPPNSGLAKVIMKNGKKRVAPTLVSSFGGTSTDTNTNIISNTSNSINQGNKVMEFNQPSYSVPKDLKRKEEFQSDSENSIKRRREFEPVEFIGSIAINPLTSFSRVRISVPKIRSSFILQSPNDDSLSLQINNGSGNVEKPSRVSLQKNESRIIFDYVPKLISLAAGGEGNFWAISTADGTLYVYSNSGRKIFPAITLGTPLSFLESKGKFLLAATSIGEIYVWDILKQKAVFEPTSLYPLLSRSNPELLTRAENLTMVSVTNNGIPIVTLSNGNGYLYDKDMEVWNVVSDSWWAFGSQYWDARSTAYDSNDVISILQKKTNDEIVRRGRGKFLQQISKTMLMKEGYENLEKIISLAHLENKMMINLKLENITDFKNLLIVYCKRISEMDLKSKLVEIFQNLYYEEFKIQTLKNHDVLKEIIFACAKIRSVQRVLIDYATLLGILDQVIL